VEFLSDKQAAVYGQFIREPGRAELERFFFLDDTDLRRVRVRRGDTQSGRVRGAGGDGPVLGAFLSDWVSVPVGVVRYVAEQVAPTAETGELMRRYAGRDRRRWGIRGRSGRRWVTATFPLATLEGLTAAARKGSHGGRPPVITADMLHTVLRRRANGESVEQIRPHLIIPNGKRKGQHPSPASIYRALAEHDKAQTYPEAIDQAHADFAALQAST